MAKARLVRAIGPAVVPIGQGTYTFPRRHAGLRPVDEAPALYGEPVETTMIRDDALPGVSIAIESREFRRELTMPPGDTHIISFNLTRKSSDIRARYVGGRRSSGYRRIGAASFLPAGVGLHAVGPDTGASLLMCRLDPSRFAAALGSAAEMDLDRLAGCIDIRDKNILSGLQRISEECRRPRLGSELLLEALTAALAVDLARWIDDGCQFAPEIRSLETLDSYLIPRLAEHPSLEEVAAACGVRPRRLSKELQLASGRSFAAYLADLRVRWAGELLETTDLALKEVCFASGFRHVSSFTSAFREATGETPSLYRQRRRPRYAA
jgi:AraC family transcriptional regulator